MTNSTGSVLNEEQNRRKRQKIDQNQSRSTRVDGRMRSEGAQMTNVAPYTVESPGPAFLYGDRRYMPEFCDHIFDCEAIQASIPSSTTDAEEDCGTELLCQEQLRLPSRPLRSRQGENMRRHDEERQQSDDERGLESEIAMTGSWCRLPPDELVLGNPCAFLCESWHPEMLDVSRLSTPDLAPMSTHYQFCTCCPDNVLDEDKINDMWYFGSKARVEQQGELNECPFGFSDVTRYSNRCHGIYRCDESWCKFQEGLKPVMKK